MGHAVIHDHDEGPAEPLCAAFHGSNRSRPVETRPPKVTRVVPCQF
ncbi:hypothetical protein [Alloactinosynnema sp. L-07]|nr:hypothetical protein [Alloactinosynnema sp. L-07]